MTIAWPIHLDGQSLGRREGKREVSSATGAHQLGSQLLQYTGTTLEVYG